MFAVLSRRLRFAFLLLATLVGIIVAPVAQADATDAIQTCSNYLDAQDYARAETAAKILLQRNDLGRTEERDTQFCLGRAYDGLNRASDALLAFQKVESLSDSADRLAASYDWLSTLYGRTGDLDHCELYAQRAIKLYKGLGNKSGEATMLSNLGVNQFRRGNTERALAFYQEALALEPDEAKKPTTLGNIASIYIGREEYAKAIKLLRQASEIDRRNGDAHDAAGIQFDLGVALRLQGRLIEAKKELTESLNTNHLFGDRSLEASTYWNLAVLSKAQKNIPQARKWYEKAEASYRESGDIKSADEIANLLAGK